MEWPGKTDAMKPVTDEEESGCGKKIAAAAKKEIRWQVGRGAASERGVR